MTKFLGALDLGSENIKFLLGAINSKSLTFVDYFKFSSQGVRKGSIEQPKKLIESLKDGFAKVLKKHAVLPSEICLAQTGSHIRSIEYEAMLPIGGLHHLIDKKDIESVNRLAKEKKLTDQQLFIHHFKQYYTVDNKLVEDPYGQPANHFGVHYRGLFGNAQNIKDAIFLTNQCGFRVKELVFSGLASAMATTSSMERENGICVVDIGAEITEFIAFKHQHAIAMGTLPVGGRNFTNDLYSGLRIHLDDSERIKKERGIPLMESEAAESEFWAIGNQSIGDKRIKTKNVQIILQARAQELFSFIQKTLNGACSPEELMAGCVLTGGGALLKNIEKVAAQVFHCDCCVRGPLIGNASINAPSDSSCVGLLHFALKQMSDGTSSHSHRPILRRLREWFS